MAKKLSSTVAIDVLQATRHGPIDEVLISTINGHLVNFLKGHFGNYLTKMMNMQHGRDIGRRLTYGRRSRSRRSGHSFAGTFWLVKLIN